VNILITDPNYKHSLGIVRALGRIGYYPYVLSFKKGSLCFHSKFCKGEMLVPDYDNKDFERAFLNSLSKYEIDLVIPVGASSFKKLVLLKELIGKISKMIAPDIKTLNLALSKKETYKFAEKVGISYPFTIYPSTYKEVKNISKELQYPVVIKGIYEAGRSIIDYVNNSNELLNKYKKICSANGFKENKNLPMLQEYIKGGGYGFFALYQRGKCKRIFMHKRIREYPPSGGYSTCAESFYDPQLKEYGMRLLDALKWHGVAMVEFKKDERDGEYKLMEINPKFWGSLDLALAAGVNFPYYLCEMAMGKELNYSEEYNRNIRFHWPFSGDVQHIIKKPSSFPKFFVDCVNPKVKSNIWLEDLKPNILEMRNLAISLISKRAKKVLKSILRKA